MQAEYPADFNREQGCTEADWLRWLPGAVRARSLALGAGQARVAIGDGALTLRWQVLPERRIALVRLPRLAMHYRFEGVDEAERRAFMRYFDLYMQRGGG
jgi:hypothetical protein